jgi:hypothetical protein
LSPPQGCLLARYPEASLKGKKARGVEWCSQHPQQGKRVEAVESFVELILREE